MKAIKTTLKAIKATVKTIKASVKTIKTIVRTIETQLFIRSDLVFFYEVSKHELENIKIEENRVRKNQLNTY